MSPTPPNFRIDFPPELPISARAQEIVDAIGAHQVIVLAGETGSGKTTQIPKMCLAAGRGRLGRIACTQPRRVAALSISRRVAEELAVEWGRAVGCKIRFNDRTSAETVIKFMTDGMLLAEVQGDPLLRDYDTVIIDEAHERSLNIDFLLGHLRQLRFRRPDLKIIITSATIDTQAFSKAFDDAPIIEVSGRTYPVEVIYAPLDSLGDDRAEGDEPEAKAEAMHYVDGAVEAVGRIVGESDSGDILVFMPSERDIRETRELIDGRRLKNCETIPLFGRLSGAEQERVFAPSRHRKIIIATNIAETSLTLPGIRFVVDTGLARISRYAPQGRTRRLPIEPVAQSSADQRKGRAGRVAAGVCIRLYSEKDFNERPRFAQPEIQRANLADVILRMKAFGLGDIERFPFINQPAAKAVRSGYLLLEELGALTDGGPGRELTPLGRELARLPVDPTVGRMILQARGEKAVAEVAVIAAGLSVQDPRERPLDAREKADAAHRRFVHPDSDFLTLLNIWDAFHEQFENLSQSRLRRFCRDHFLSYTRMREWRDIHSQLVDTLAERSDFRGSSVFDGMPAARRAEETLLFGSPGFRAIHRSVLAGLLGNIAVRDDEKGGYKATHDRRVGIFPGSTLFAREERRNAEPRRGVEKEKRGSKQPRWLMVAEIMETTRLYARTCARLDPLWALELGAHVVKVAHSEPFWDEAAGRVRVKQRSRLYGLELESRAVSYSRIDPAHATDIFIREGLVNDTITWPFDFLAHNRAVREQVESQMTRVRDRGYLNLDEGIHRFYVERLQSEVDAGRAISAVPELVDLVRERKAADPRFLMMAPEDLRDPAEEVPDAEAFPTALPLTTAVLSLNYNYKPGRPEDGVTLDVPVREAESLTPAALDWAVPGHLGAKVEHYLRALPKEIRRDLMPLADTARALTTAAAAEARLTAKRDTLPVVLARLIEGRLRIRLDPGIWADRPPPDHLRVRVRVVDDEEKEICADRDLEVISRSLADHQSNASASVHREDPAAWRAARIRWEKAEQIEWNFGDVPAQVPVTEQGGVAIVAWPGLRAGREGVALRLFRTEEEAKAATREGLSRLIEQQLRYELAWLQKDLRNLRSLGAAAMTLVSIETLQEQAAESVRRWVCDPERVKTLTAGDFRTAVETAKFDLRGLVPKLLDLLKEIFEGRQQLLVHPNPAPGQAAALAALLPEDFISRTPYPRLAGLPRYLRAMKLRADRWRQNPAKDAERARQIEPYAKAAERLRGREGGEAFRWLVEEFRVSLFAQEVGTAEPVSAVKLDRALAGLDGGKGPGATEAAEAKSVAKPILSAPVNARADAKKNPLKSLDALGGLFRK